MTKFAGYGVLIWACRFPSTVPTWTILHYLIYDMQCSLQSTVWTRVLQINQVVPTAPISYISSLPSDILIPDDAFALLSTIGARTALWDSNTKKQEPPAKGLKGPTAPERARASPQGSAYVTGNRTSVQRADFPERGGTSQHIVTGCVQRGRRLSVAA